MKSGIKLKIILIAAIVVCFTGFITFNTSIFREKKSAIAKGPPYMHKSKSSVTADLPTKRIPDAIVVGAGKCGTDALITYLNTSKSFLVNTIFTAGMRELNFFNHNYEKGLDWYVSQMPPATKSQVVIEKCAPYFWDKDVPERVFKARPDMKLIMVLCDPVKRLVSLYAHINSYKRADGTDPLPPFADLIKLEDNQLVEKPNPQSSQPFLETGKYSTFIEQWKKFFPLRQMVFVSGEELIKNPVAQVQRVAEFLGKSGAVTSDTIYFDKERGFHCVKGYDGEKRCMDRATKGRQHPKLSSEVLAALQAHFEPYNKKLADMIGVDFGWPLYFGQ